MHKIIDTHSHLYSNKFDQDLDAVIQRAKEVLHAIVLPNIDDTSIPGMHALMERDPEFFFPAMGLHPCHVEPHFEDQLAVLHQYLQDFPDRYCAIGETGLDLYWDKTTLERQQAALNIQMEWAAQYQLPIILHARDAIDEVLDAIESFGPDKLTGVVHCFDGNIEQSQRIQAFGTFKMGIGGIVTYRKDVQAMVQSTPLDFLILETDSPYLPPVPHRKDKPRRNESSYTKYVAEKIAELHGVSQATVAEVTNLSARSLFPKLKVTTPTE
ncbi:TatD family hydrolase [Pontibacter sp. G13]|uniref:TatD family hydrolase n=1 Tax=Pontibacter sp. G13 TaxID=3074898 RepID=UPI00288B0600|nr:TatD family hydrolase [Pontibacter sp. G13]WNJ16140.1 TatD family hydrolase [Pontibacter sp. G13]